MPTGLIRELHVPHARQRAGELRDGVESHARDVIGIELQANLRIAPIENGEGGGERSHEIVRRVERVQRLDEHLDSARRQGVGGK
jgi:hypothetical protein